MKDILLVTNYWHFEDEKKSSRYRFLAELITSKGYKLEIITSSFYHGTKMQRSYKIEDLSNLSYKMNLIYEPGYKKNVSIKRIISHNIFARNVIKYLENRKKPDLIYCVVPSLDVADVVSKFAKKNKIPLIVDIQDLWPEAFKMVIDIPILSDLLFKPMELKANNIYKRADQIIAVSDTYVERAHKLSKECKEGLSVYLGVDLNEFDKISETSSLTKSEEEKWIIYIGTLGHSYDIPLIIQTMLVLKNKGQKNIKFKILGDGPLKKSFEQYALELGVHVDFLGKVSYEDVVKYLVVSDIAVNPIVGKSAASIINKVGDYAAAGLPVINTQKSLEYRQLIDKYRAGVNCIEDSPEVIAEKIIELFNNDVERKQLGINNRYLAEEKFNRNTSYMKIIEKIDNLIEERY